PEKYNAVTEEIVRGVTLVTGLSASAAEPGWVQVACRSRGMAGWLVRAIVMENVVARHDSQTLYFPADPDFRLEKEIKNVITVVAKANHYWTNHMSADRQSAMDSIDSKLTEPAPLNVVQADPAGYRRILEHVQTGIAERLGMTCCPNRYIGWIGVACVDVQSALCMMR